MDSNKKLNKYVCRNCGKVNEIIKGWDKQICECGTIIYDKE